MMPVYFARLVDPLKRKDLEKKDRLSMRALWILLGILQRFNFMSIPKELLYSQNSRISIQAEDSSTELLNT